LQGGSSVVWTGKQLLIFGGFVATGGDEIETNQGFTFTP
jgi:hypothetical protein